MKILILANDDGGLFLFRRELLEALVKEHKVYVSVPGGGYVNEIEAIGCKVIVNRLLDRRGTNPLREMKLIRHYNRMIGDIVPGIVLTYTIKPNVYGGMVCRWKRISYIANITGLGISIENGGVFQRLILALYKVGLAHAEKIFFQNTANKDFFCKHKVIKERYDVLPGSGVNTARHCYEPYPDEGEALTFSTIGRIMRDKGINEILTAAEAVKKEFSQVRFRLVGYFDEDYEDMVKKSEQEGLVEYVEHQKDIHAILAESHAVIHASYHEGMSNVLLEAASTGRPVIATNVPGCLEAFEEGVTGIGFEPKDSGDLIRAVREFIALPHPEKEAMGKAGREKMEREFNRGTVIEKYMAEIERLQMRSGSDEKKEQA